MSKVLIITASFPPRMSGASTILNNLCQELEDNDVAVFCQGSQFLHNRVDTISVPNCEIYYYNVSIWWLRFSHYWYKLTGYHVHSNTLLYLSVPSIVWRGIQIVRKHQPAGIFSTINSEGPFLVASYFVHKITRLPLVIYGIDLLNQGIFIEKIMRFLFKRKILKAAKFFFVISQALKDYYYNNYKISAEILPIPIPLPKTMPITDKVAKTANLNGSTVLFTGLIYDACLDSLKNMTEAIKTLSHVPVRFCVCTPSSSKDLVKMGIYGEHVERQFVNRREALVLQREADILFLPQAFRSPNQAVVNTLFPTKTVEYLNSGTPILVHGPKNCQIVQYAKQNGFALIVDRPDVEELRQALMRLLKDEGLRFRLIKNAWQTAKKHDAKLIAKTVKGAFDLQ